MKIEEVLRCVTICDDALLRRPDNITRRLFFGPSSLDLNLNPNVLNVAKEVAENTKLCGDALVNKLFDTYSVQTIRILSLVEEDSKLVLVMMTMRAWRVK